MLAYYNYSVMLKCMYISELSNQFLMHYKLNLICVALLHLLTIFRVKINPDHVLATVVRNYTFTSIHLVQKKADLGVIMYATSVILVHSKYQLQHYTWTEKQCKYTHQC